MVAFEEIETWVNREAVHYDFNSLEELAEYAAADLGRELPAGERQELTVRCFNVAHDILDEQE